MQPRFANEPSFGRKYARFCAFSNVLTIKVLAKKGGIRCPQMPPFNIFWAASAIILCGIYRRQMWHPSSINATQKMLKA